MLNETAERTNLIALDKQLRAAELNLQQSEAKLDNTNESLAASSIGNLEKIRDILFGGYVRDYEKRFKRLEERLSQEGIQLRDELFQRLKALEEVLVNETENLSEKSKLERQERYEAQQDLVREINVMKTEINNRFTQLDEQASKDIKQLRQLLQSQIQELTMQLRQQKDHLTLLIQQEVEQLKEEKLDRHTLAAFFTELALRLNKDLSAVSKMESS